MCVCVCMNFLTFLRISLRKLGVLPAVGRFNASAAPSYSFLSFFGAATVPPVFLLLFNCSLRGSPVAP